MKSEIVSGALNPDSMEAQKHNVTLLHHEIMERKLMKQ